MPEPVRTTFGGLTAVDFETHAKAVLDSHVTADSRKAGLSYLNQVLAKDKAALDLDLKTLYQKRQVYRKQQKVADALHSQHPFDYVKTPAIFAAQSPSDAAIAAMLTTNNTDVSIGTRTLTTDLVFSGSRVQLVGTGASGSAVDGTLACTCVVNGQISLSGADTVIRGVKFVCGARESIKHIGGCRNLTLEDCIFENTSTYWDGVEFGSIFIEGEGEHFSGNLTIRNCQIGTAAGGFGSWMLADVTTQSAQPPSKKLDDVIIDKCRFTNCAGSFAIRGMPDLPTESCTITNNVVDYGSPNIQHAYFWATFECNNCLKVVCTDNTVLNASKPVGGTRHFFQTWSRSGHAWTLHFERNKIDGFNIALALACSATFYAPSILDELYAVGSAPGEISDVDLAVSKSYPWLTGTYAPENIATIPVIPTNFADNLSSYPAGV